MAWIPISDVQHRRLPLYRTGGPDVRRSLSARVDRVDDEVSYLVVVLHQTDAVVVGVDWKQVWRRRPQVARAGLDQVDVVGYVVVLLLPGDPDVVRETRHRGA